MFGQTIHVGTITGTLSLTDHWTSVMDRAALRLGGFENQFNAFATKTERVGRALVPMSLAASLALTGIGGSALKMATTLNESIANVSALLTDLSGPTLDKTTTEMKSKVQGLAVEFGKSTTDISGGLYEVVSSLGFTNDTFDQLSVSARAGAAGLATTQEAFNFLSATTKAYGDTSARAFRQAADLGFQAVNYGQTTFPQLASSIGGIAPIAKVAGVSMKEMFAIIATATGVTGNTSEVVTQMASAINGLLSPSKDLQQMYDKLGISSGQALIQEKGLVGALQDVAKHSAATGVPIMDLLGRKESFIITASLAGTQAQRFATNLDHMGRAAAANGSIVNDAFQKQTQGINAAGFAWQQFKAEVMVAMQDLGDLLIPIVMRAARELRPLWEGAMHAVKWFGDLPQPVQTAAIAVLALAAAAAPLLIAVASVARLSQVAAGAVAWLATQFGVSTTQALINTPVLLANAGAAAKVSSAVKFAAGEQLAFNFMTKEGTQLLLPLSGEMTKTATAATGAARGATFFGSVVAGLTSPIGLLVIGVTGLVLATRALTGSWEFITGPAKAFWGLLVDIGSIAKSLFDIGTSLWNLYGGWSQALRDMFPHLSAVVDFYRQLWSLWNDWPDDPLKPAQKNLSSFGQAITQGAKIWAEQLRGVADALKELERIKAGGLPTPDRPSLFLPPAPRKPLDLAALMQTPLATPPPAPPRGLSEELQKLQDRLFGRDVIQDANDLLKVLGGVKNVTKLTRENQEQLLESIVGSLEAYKALGRTAPEELHKVASELLRVRTLPDAMEATQREVDGILRERAESSFALIRANFSREGALVQQGGKVWHDLQVAQQSSLDQQIIAAAEWAQSTLAEFAYLEQTAPELFGRITTAVGVEYNRMVVAAKNSATRQLSAWEQIWSGLPDTITNALAGGGNVLRAITNQVGNVLIGAGQGPVARGLFGGLNRLWSAGMNDKVVNLIGNIIPGLGPVIGAGLNKLWEGIRSLFGGPSGRSLVVEFAEQLGGFDKLRQRLSALGDEGDRMWVRLTQNVGSASNARIQIATVTKAFENLEKIQSQIGDRLGGLQDLLGRFGGRAPASLKPLIDELLKSSRLTDSMRRDLEAMAKGPTWEAIAEAAARYGVEQDQLGQGFQQLKSNATFDQVFSDFTMFSDAKLLTAEVMQGMARQINDLLEKSRKFGTAIPEFMKPVLDIFLQAGLLTDEFGNKLGTLDGFTFTAVQSSLDGIRDVLLEIRDLLTQPILSVDEQVEIRMSIKNKRMGRDVEEIRAAGAEPVQLSAGTAGQFVDWGGGTSAVLHDEEAVVRRDDVGSLASDIGRVLASAMDGAGGKEMVVMLDGEPVGRIVGRTRSLQQEVGRGISENTYELGSKVDARVRQVA